MTFRIERVASTRGVTVVISGEIAGGRPTELRAFLQAGMMRGVEINLGAVTRVDLEGVRLLHEHEVRGGTLTEVPGYVRARIDDIKKEDAS